MKKAIVCVFLAILLVFLFQPQLRDSLAAWARGLSGRTEETAQEYAAPNELLRLTEEATDYMDVTLYFRLSGTGLLGAAREPLDIRREETIARRIVEGLLTGPDFAHSRLTNVFPRGTKVLSVTTEGQTAFVTLSREFLGRPDGAPMDWEDDGKWQKEAALRRTLGVQSIVLSLTENGQCQRVQLLVADSDDDAPERIPLIWFNPQMDDLSVVLAASARDESFVLTPKRALETLLVSWQRHDWEGMYPLLYAAAGDEAPDVDSFAEQMESSGVSLLDFSVSQGVVDLGGMRATLVLDAQIDQTEGGRAQIVRESVQLSRVQDNWMMSLGTLRSLMERD